MKLLTTIVLMTLSAITFANETPKQFAPFSIVTKEVSDKLDIEYKSMVDSIIHITRKTEFAYTEADIRKAATVVAVEYSPCKYTQRIDVLECQSIRNELISYLTNSVMESTEFKKLKKVNNIDDMGFVESESLSLAERTKTILRKGKYSPITGLIEFNEPEFKVVITLMNSVLSEQSISKLYEEVMVEDFNNYLKEIEETAMSLKGVPIITAASKMTVKTFIYVFSDMEFECRFIDTEVSISCRPLMEKQFILSIIFLVSFFCLVRFLVSFFRRVMIAIHDMMNKDSRKI